MPPAPTNFHTTEEAQCIVLSALHGVIAIEGTPLVIDDEHQKKYFGLGPVQRRKMTVLVYLVENTREHLDAVRAVLDQLSSIDIERIRGGEEPQRDPGLGDEVGAWTFQVIYHAPKPD